MAIQDLNALLPFLILAVTSLVVMLWISFERSHAAAVLVSIAGLVLALAVLPIVSELVPYRLTRLFLVDAYGVFYMRLVFAAGIVVALLSYGYLERQAINREEFYIVLILASLGSIALVTSSHFASFFLGLELLSVSLYVLIAYLRTEALALEAGLKYLILAATSSAFLLFGMALIYHELGTMDLGRLASLAADGGGAAGSWTLGLAFMITGIGFKLAVVPFHMWTPDVYQGAPAPVTGFIATVSKGAMFALLLRYFMAIDAHRRPALMLIFSIIAIASMFLGNLLALRQDNVKRMLAYSSIAHLGYLLVAFLAGGELAVEAVTYYLVAYFATTLGAFGVVGVLCERQAEADALEDYRGLFWRRPGLAAVFTAMLLSLAGIPLTAGFIGKFYVVAAGVDSARWLLVLALVANSAIGVYYYLRVVVAMFHAPVAAPPEGTKPLPAVSLGGRVALGALFFLVIWLGVYPTWLQRVIGAAVGTFPG